MNTLDQDKQQKVLVVQKGEERPVRCAACQNVIRNTHYYIMEYNNTTMIVSDISFCILYMFMGFFCRTNI